MDGDVANISSFRLIVWLFYKLSVKAVVLEIMSKNVIDNLMINFILYVDENGFTIQYGWKYVNVMTSGRFLLSILS